MTDLTEGHVTLALIADALFCSGLATGDRPTSRQLAAAIRGAQMRHRNWDGCTRAVASAFAANPRDAEAREIWARRLAEAALKADDIQVDIHHME